ncbi:MAG: hemerythrin domain-containing protein [Polyangiales bacterium]
MSNVAVVLPQIPREDWQSHPRFRTQALLLGSHANFRRVSRFLIDHAAHEQFAGLHSLFDRWIAAMRSHEAYEERKLYPYLEYRWGVSLDEARRGHAELHTRADGVVDAFRSLAHPADPAVGSESAHENRVLHALRAHDRTLGAHLDVEEDAVVPLLLALDPEEFDRYYHSPISMLIPAEPR